MQIMNALRELGELEGQKRLQEKQQLTAAEWNKACNEPEAWVLCRQHLSSFKSIIIFPIIEEIQKFALVYMEVQNEGERNLRVTLLFYLTALVNYCQ